MYTYKAGDNVWYKTSDMHEMKLATVKNVEVTERKLIPVGRGFKFRATIRFEVEDRGTEWHTRTYIDAEDVKATATPDYLESLADDSQVFDFYGASGNVFRLNDVTLKAIEDENDGYRSYLETVVTYPGEVPLYTFPLAQVKIIKIDASQGDGERYAQFQGYVLYDVEDDHVWLVIGTNYMDDYYPSYVFDYYPKGVTEDE